MEENVNISCNKLNGTALMLSGTNYGLQNKYFICAVASTILCQNTSTKCTVICFHEKQLESLLTFS